MTAWDAVVREPSVAGSFYPARADELREQVAGLLERSGPPPAGRPLGVLVPHAGLVYSGSVAATGWRALLDRSGPEPTVVLLGTNHSAWFDGVAVDDADAWRLPGAEVAVDLELARRILGLGAPFLAGREAHRAEHSIEVQLPIVSALRPGARIVACSVAAGTGTEAVEAGGRLGALLGGLRLGGREVLVAVSTDMAHYPDHAHAVRVTERLAPLVCSLDPAALAARERAEAGSGAGGMACAMCGVQPAVLGLAALRAMGARGGTVLAAATSADAGGDRDRTVGYLAVAFS